MRTQQIVKLTGMGGIQLLWRRQGQGGKGGGMGVTELSLSPPKQLLAGLMFRHIFEAQEESVLSNNEGNISSQVLKTLKSVRSCSPWRETL